MALDPRFLRLLATSAMDGSGGLTAPSEGVGLGDPLTGLLGAAGEASAMPEPPVYAAPPVSPIPMPGFLDRAAAGLASTPAYAPRPYESAGSAVASGLLSGLARGFGGGRLLGMQTEQANREATAKANATEADRNYANQLETWKVRLKKYMDDSGNVKVGKDLINLYPGLRPFSGQSIPTDKLLPYVSQVAASTGKNARTVDPNDDALLSALVGSKTITSGQANYFRSRGMTEDERSTLATKGVPGGAGGMGGGSDPMTPDAIAFVGDYLIRTGQLLPFGMGNATNRGKVFDYVATHSDAGSVVSNKTNLAADQTSLTQTQRALDGTAAFENTARANAKVLGSYIQNLSDTGSPWLNRPLREWQAMAAGDPKMAGYRTALQTVVNEYSRLLTANPNMTGEMSDTARKEGARLLDGSLTVGQLLESLAVLERDAQNRIGSYQERVNTIKTRIRGGSGASTTGGVGAGAPTDSPAPAAAPAPRKGGFWDALVRGGH